MITFEHKGNFSKTERFFNMLLHEDWKNLLNMYGQKGVDALRSATPVDTGLAASSWNYIISQDKDGYHLTWTNDDIEGGINVVVLIDRGHATKSGTWVPGYHFIDNAIDPIIKQLAEEVTF